MTELPGMCLIFELNSSYAYNRRSLTIYCWITHAIQGQCEQAEIYFGTDEIPDPDEEIRDLVLGMLPPLCETLGL